MLHELHILSSLLYLKKQPESYWKSNFFFISIPSTFGVQQRFSNSVSPHIGVSREVASCVAINLTFHNAIK
jgi:hypothetical protein